MIENRALLMMQKYFGLVLTMRRHQAAYFRNRMDYDKKKSMEYERKVDEYSSVLKKAGLEPIFETDNQRNLF